MDADRPDRPGRKSSYRAALITLLCSLLLGAGSCFGFLSTLKFHGDSPRNTAFAVGFLACLLVFFGSVVWMVVKAIRGRYGR